MRSSKLVAVTTAVVVASSTAAWARPINVAKRARIAQTRRTFSLTPGDFNRDGRDDVFLVRHNPDNPPQSIPYSTLYRGTGKRFKRHRTKQFRKTDKHGCAWGRANRDKRPDLFCTVGLTQKSVNELWIQKRGGGFVNRTKRFGLTRKSRGRYRYATFIHANRDRRPDLYVTRYTGPDFRGRYPGDNWPNELWINKRGRRFRRAPKFGLNKPIGAKKDTATCAQAVDFNRDGHQDLLVCAHRLHLYKNNRGRGFTDVTSRKNIKRKAADARFVDLNRDGKRDFVKLTTTTLTVRRGKRKGRLGKPRVIGRTSAGIRLAFGRFDRGRSVDIYVLSSRGRNKKDQPDKIFLNRKRGRWKAKVLPAVKRGAGDDVARVDYNNNGRADFLVTNGHKKTAGPVQLWTWRRRR